MAKEISGKDYLLKIREDFEEVTEISWYFHHKRKRKDGMLYVAFLNPTLNVINSVIEKIKKYVDFKEVQLRSIDPIIEKKEFNYVVDEIPINEWIDNQGSPLYKNYAYLSEEFKESQLSTFKKLDELKESGSDEYYDFDEQYVKTEQKEKLKIPSVIIGFISFKTINLD